ncbi:LuxR C-terminal-related transcriptional regulator [Cellulomonas denverensis]|uniref:HTH luxR-type domain-containing protein n=1 Tax=Cellulomonas denverensis TaxID=264297 RepID=A0A7X6QZK1_9CELL|nr:LuxR C-terminal-related transcriptional regulator [Cellulomonas denverensis]NKY23197.1 hypothetical protein [Cellulomonas denverensis]GIG26709.1 hypothetical protein Cde04nite_29530 [Cellulomonas denverensis]
MRNAEVHRIVDLALRRRSVRVVGGRWTGRTTTLRAVHRALSEAGRETYHVSCTPGVPAFESLRMSLPPRVSGLLDAGPPAFSEVYTVLRDYLTGDERVVLLDDADVLDEASRGVITLLHKHLGTAIIATTLPARSEDDGGAWLASTSHPLVQLHLGGLGLEETHQLLSQRADGPVSPQVAARIHSDSAGVPGLALAILDGAIGHGAIRMVGDTWTGDSVWSPEVQGVYATYLAGYRPEVREAVEILAAAGAVPSGLATALVGADLLDELNAAELVQAVPAGPDYLIALDPPGLADYVDRKRMTGRQRRLLTEAIGRVLTGPWTMDEDTTRLIARMKGRLSEGTDLATYPGRQPPEGPEYIGGIFAQTFDADVAAATVHWRADRQVRTAVPLLRVLLSGTRDRLAIHRVFAETDVNSDVDSFDYVEFAYYRARWLLGEGLSAEQMEAQLTATLPDGIVYREALSSLLYTLHVEFDRLPGDYARVLAPRCAGDGLDAAAARVALAACHVVAGRADEAHAILDVDRADWPRFLVDSADWLTGLALYARGDFTEGFALGRGMAERATARLSRPLYVAACVVSAFDLGARLELGAARSQLLPVLSSGAMAGTLVLPPDRSIPVLLASLSIYVQHRSVSSGLVDLAAGDNGCGEAMPFASRTWVAALELYAHGRLDECAELLDGTIRQLRERGYALAADTTEMNRLLLRYDARRAEAFTESARRIGGPLYVSYLQAKRAMVDQDPEALSAVAATLKESGSAQAVTSYLTAAGMFADRNDFDAANAARAAARALQQERHLQPARQAGIEHLTDREWEVVHLVARGWPNGDIAEKLFLSRRTVESHIYSIRRKTGAASRAAVGNLDRYGPAGAIAG